MTPTSWFFENGTTPRPTANDPIRDHRARIQMEEREKAERRRLELAEQRSDVNSPEVRIRAWEKVHGLRLPTDANHPILDVIAVATRLTLEQVREEQRARSAASAHQSQG
ncbi:MAG TPA: hypothetical protein VFS52_06225 [Steroidobacteraceae bacterium]|jgi:hypothetical protein|nr:hypothetical protein [Steroidobacteraceae bacterium]